MSAGDRSANTRAEYDPEHLEGDQQILTCPDEWIERYEQYMIGRKIPYKEVLVDGRLWFVIPRKCRPHCWKL
jgi:hypothetical protein